MKHIFAFVKLTLKISTAIAFCLIAFSVHSQVAPSASEIETFSPLHQAAYAGDAKRVSALIQSNTDIEVTDSFGRTPLHVATFASHDEVISILAKSGANVDALENQAYDAVTIAAVADDYDLLDLLLTLGASPANITSPYDGTALIAAAHLGHHRVVKRLVDAGAPIDHINNLGWTALIEAVVLGDGGSNHVTVVAHLLDGGASCTISDRQGMTPHQLAIQYGYARISKLLDNCTS